MARRSSARIRARKSTTPQPSKITDAIQDGQLRTPKTAPPLASVRETEEMPGAFPETNSPADDTPSKLAKHIANAVAGNMRTPQGKKPRASMEEMHPEKFHASTSKPQDEARWLGISAMIPQTEPPKGVNKWAPEANTPTKSTRESDAYEFTFRAQSLELSSEAQRMMAEKREEAARIKQQMMKITEEEEISDGLHGRKIAKAKSKSGRYSDAHRAEFQKMGSIATHAAASRPNSRDQMEELPSLKRTSSKSGLLKAPAVTQSSSKSVHQTTTMIPLAAEKASSKRNVQPSPEEGGSPAKRVKLTSPNSPSPSKSASVVRVATAGYQTAVAPLSARSNQSRLTTPTKSSLARSATVKANKTSMIPSLVRTPSKSTSKVAPSRSQAADSLLLARSPTKIAHMSAKKEATRQEVGSPLLTRSPTKSLFADRLVGNAQNKESSSDEDRTPFLSRSPARLGHRGDGNEEADRAPKTPILSRSPTRVPAEANPFAAIKSTPGPQTNLTNRFKLLRQSPIKSILRSPQRLYSDDPEKIANGTHLATPPTHVSTTPTRPRAGFVPGAMTEPVVKHVDFSASTKSDDESPLPSKAAIIEPSTSSLYPTLPSYPNLPPHSPLDRNAKSRRQTLGPLTSISKDFTFRAGADVPITFGPSLPADKAARPSIRHVSAEPEAESSQISRKRKFVDEEDDDVFAPADEDVGMEGGSDKENDANTANIAAGKVAAAVARETDEGARPAKKVKRDAAEAEGTGNRGAGEKKVPSWAQGTAAQKARANLARAQLGKKRAVVNQHRLLSKVAASHVARSGGVGGAAAKAGSVVPRAGSVSRDGSAGPEGGEKEREKVVLSRARLDALSQPKRRVGA